MHCNPTFCKNKLTTNKQTKKTKSFWMWCCLSLFLNARIFNIDLRRDFSLIFFSNGDQFYLCSYFILKKKKLYILFLYFCFLFQKRSAYVAAPYDPSLY